MALLIKLQKVPSVEAFLRSKPSEADVKQLYNEYNEASSLKQKDFSNLYEPHCDNYFETDSYKNGEEDTWGYAICCETLGFCGMSGWLIFLIIVIVLGVLASAGAALWFFYLNRFFGGKEEEEEEKKEDYSNTEDIGSVEISVATY
uniref:Uncharacterized protein n=1 Tax=Caenorhabditis tropicalis TaxID=1561998 RepID=A0A1I7TGU8_9PELO